MRFFGKAFEYVWRIFVGAYTGPQRSLVDMRLDINGVALALGIHGASNVNGLSPRSCRQCGSMLSNSSAMLKKCGRCNKAFYCSVACQTTHWKASHSTECVEKIHSSSSSSNDDDGETNEEKQEDDNAEETKKEERNTTSPQVHTAEPTIVACSNCNDADRKTKRCNKCKLVQYCGPICQKAHWRAGHKALCVSSDK
jgi:hypothetical protein